ncbi:MAG: hypothetical protein M1511_14015 [Deltaproteobacteria bacterium]|nr:hypothetical protein [Deltaproteobacteria bacterium]
MRTIEPILTAGIAVAVILGMIVPNIAYAGPDSLVSTFGPLGVSVLPVFHGGGHGFHGGYYGHGPGFYGGWGFPGYYTAPYDSGTYQNGNQTCVWNGYNWRCYEQ